MTGRSFTCLRACRAGAGTVGKHGGLDVKLEETLNRILTR